MAAEELERMLAVSMATLRSVYPTLLISTTGGEYIPPAKLRKLHEEELHMLKEEQLFNLEEEMITDKSGAAHQRIAWEAMKKSIQGCMNKVNSSNLGIITRKLLDENIIRGRGLLARSVIQAQAASPTFTPVYAELIAIINSKFEIIGYLVLQRLMLQFKRGFRRNDKPLCISSVTFIAHLVNQHVAHHLIALNILRSLIETPTDDSVEVALAILKECGLKLWQVSPPCTLEILKMLRNIMHPLDERVQRMIVEVSFQLMLQIKKGHETVPYVENQIGCHLILLSSNDDAQDILNMFQFDAEYLANEEEYKMASGRKRRKRM